MNRWLSRAKEGRFDLGTRLKGGEKLVLGLLHAIFTPFLEPVRVYMALKTP
jgi:hypothetical protein